uniref:Fibronectin type-III domain-containing protein n=1 Tax=Catharus ustulatus TaxID=91951 RepID=A0A8C3TYV4_CATUS
QDFLWVCSAPAELELSTLGPPRVNSVSASPESLLISLSPPFPPEHGDLLQFLVSYWEDSSSPQRLSVTETLFQIGNLKESTVYCFSVQVQLKIFSGHLQGEQSAPECHRTALSEATRAGYISALFLVALLFVNLLAAALLLLWKHRQKLKYWAQPPLQIPPSLLGTQETKAEMKMCFLWGSASPGTQPGLGWAGQAEPAWSWLCSLLCSQHRPCFSWLSKGVFCLGTPSLEKTKCIYLFIYLFHIYIYIYIYIYTHLFIYYLFELIGS